jgi:hypothetical protein
MRGFKQFIYGLIYLSVLAAVLFWLWPAQVEDCQSSEECSVEVSAVTEVSFGQPNIFLATGATSAFSEVKNSGASMEVAYEIIFYNQFREKLGSLKKEGQFPASSVRLVSGVWPQAATQAEFKILSSRELSAVILPPTPEISETLEISGNTGRLLGSLRNSSSVNLQNISVLAVFKDSLDNPIWIGDTFLTSLPSFGNADFLIVLPKDEELLKDISAGSREFFIYPLQ